MADTPHISDEQMPEYVRRCWERYREATSDPRKKGVERTKMYVGGDFQWRESELASRRAGNKPILTINRLKPSVDQVENEARNNPPGPMAYPVGGNGDKDGADILEGLIREYEYRSDAPRAYVRAMRGALAGYGGIFEMATDYVADSVEDQQIVIREVEDPDMCFIDPDSRMAVREDAAWCGKIRVLSKEKLQELAAGKKLKVLDRNMATRAAGWMQSTLGWRGNLASVYEWTGGPQIEGPYFACEFYRKEISHEKKTLYSDGIERWEDEKVPAGAKVQMRDGEPAERLIPRCKVFKYVVTALDTISKTEWLAPSLPHYWVLGEEIYIDGKQYRLSLIDGAIDSQRGLNFTVSAAAQMVNNMTFAAFIGWEGQFDIQNAQGVNPWASGNSNWAYLEVKPKWAVNPANPEQSEFLPPPTRNQWEAPIARLLELVSFFGEQIKSATSVFFDPAVQSVKDVQSGEAIKALQSQTNVGTLNWQDNLKRAVTRSYQDAAVILPQLLTGVQAATIIRPDTKHELAEIYKEFPDNPGKKKFRILGRYSLRATAGPSFATRTQQALENFMEVLKVAPQILGMPGVVAQVVRMVGEGNPDMESMADMIAGVQPGQELTPQQMKQQLQALQMSDQQKSQTIQQLQTALLAKLPELQSQERRNERDNMTRLLVAKVNASKDLDRAAADRVVDMIQSALSMAHDAAMQGSQQQADAQAQAADHQNQTQQSILAAAQEPETAGVQ